MADKIFVGSCKKGKYENQTKISFKREDLEKLTANLNSKGYVNARLSYSQQGKPYMEIVIYEQ
jgi:hypothetical protein